MFRGFITNLGKYNEGELVGRWIDFPLIEDIDDIMESIGIDGEEYEEYFFTDYDTDSYTEIIDGLGEYENIDRLNDYAEELANVGDMNHLLAYSEETGLALEECLQEYENNSTFYGDGWIGDILLDMLSNDTSVRNLLIDIQHNIDWDGVARDYGFAETKYGWVTIY